MYHRSCLSNSAQCRLLPPDFCFLLPASCRLPTASCLLLFALCTSIPQFAISNPKFLSLPPAFCLLLLTLRSWRLALRSLLFAPRIPHSEIQNSTRPSPDKFTMCRMSYVRIVVQVSPGKGGTHS